MLLRRINQGNKSKRGFTLAELLVVVAIIAILVAVSIPIFTGKLEEARKNTDLANERAAKAAAVADYMLEGEPDSYEKFYDAENGTMVELTDADKLEGYNQVKRSESKDRNTSVIIVLISSSTDSDDNLRVTVQWHDLKRELG
ncbi:putative major pilin subunit [uncultured Eubacterium sp.]|nr:putative major pilin subunit [uncultured Eubacterium sp.]